MASKETISLDGYFEGLAPLDRDVEGLAAPDSDATSALEGFQAGSLVGTLRIMRPLGRGGMGEVWVARDESLGRRVALKVLHASKAHLDDLLRREAQTTAHFSHPHIVQIYATGVHQGSVWLSLELIDGGSLRERLRGGPLAAVEAARLLLGVADAMAHAHQAGVIHQDLKPENVLIGTDGRARVADFGLARSIEVASADTEADTLASLGIPHTQLDRICGTPPYMSPEQFRGDAPSRPADVWAFGVLLWEVLRNDRPFNSASDTVATIAQRVLNLSSPPLPHDVPPALASVVQQCLSPDPAQRPTAHALHGLLEDFVRPTDADQRGPPFRGLARFTESGAQGFHGREAEVSLLVEHLRSQPILPLVGPSGTGKSSLVLGGVVPRLREQGAIWLIEVRPGRDPFGMLASGLRQSASSRTPSTSLPTGPRSPTTDDRSLRVSPGALRADPFLLGRLLRTHATQLGRTALLFVDQLEELLASSDHDTRLAYLRSIVFAADDPIDPVRVILTLRDDFLGRLALDADIQRGLSRVCVVQPPGPASLRHILEAPIHARGFRWEDHTMVDRLVDATHGLVASLPLLQVSGALLWERRDIHKRIIPRSAIDEIGGLQGALAHHADAVFAGISTQEQALQRRLLLRLVTPDETRAVLPLSLLQEAVGPGVDAAIERLVTHRLITLRRSESSDTDVELVHEALITHWHTLRQWLDEGRTDHRLAVDVEEAAQRWSRADQGLEACLSDTRLEAALTARSTRTLDLSPLADRFLEASAVHSRERQRLRRLAAGGVTALVMLLMVALAGAVWQRGERLRVQEALVTSERDRVETAQLERDSATAALLAMRSSEDSAERRSGAALVRAIAGLSLAQQVSVPDLEARLWEQVLATQARALPMKHIPPLVPDEQIAYAAPTPDGETVAIGAQRSGQLHMVTIETGHTTGVYARCPPTWQGGAWSEDGARLVHQCRDTFGVQVMDASGELLQELPCGTTGTRPGDGRGMVAWMDHQLFVGAADGVCVFDGTPLVQTRFLPLKGELSRLSVSDRWVAAALASGSTVDVASRVWDRTTGELHLELSGDPSFIRQHLVTDDYLVRRYAGSPDHLEVWSLTGSPRRVLNLKAEQLWSGRAAFDADSSHFIAPWGGQLRRWNTSDWTEDIHFALKTADRPTVSVSPDGRYTVESTWSGRIRVTGAASGAVLFDDTSMDSRIRPVRFLDRSRLLAFTREQGLLLWNLDRLPRTIIARPPDILQERLDGLRYWWLFHDGTVRTGSTTGEPSRVLGVLNPTIEGHFLATSNTWSIVSTDTGWTAWSAARPGAMWSRPAIPQVVGATISPDGQFVAVRTRTGILIVLDQHGVEVHRQRFVSPDDVVVDGQNYGKVDPAFTTVRWTPDSTALLAEHLDSGERWQCRRAPEWTCRQWPHVIRQSTLSFSPDGTRLYDRAIEHATETYRIRRLDPDSGAVQWTWEDERLKSWVAGLAGGTDRAVLMSASGQMFALTAEGALDHSVSFRSDDRSVLSFSILEDEMRVAVAGTGSRKNLWLWDLDQQRLSAKWNGIAGGGWTYEIAPGGLGPQLWARLEDRALIPLDSPPTKAIAAVVEDALAQTNLRVCRDSLEVVAVVPFPSASDPWAPPSLCAAPPPSPTPSQPVRDATP